MQRFQWEQPLPVQTAFAKIYAWASLVFLGCMVVMLASVAQWSRVEKIEAARETARTIARLTASELERRIDLADFALARVTEMDGLGGWDNLDDLRHKLQAQALRLPDLDDLWLLDATGRLRVSAMRERLPEAVLSDAEFFTAHRDSPPMPGLPRLGGLRKSPFDGELVLPLSRRIGDLGGRFLGVAVATFRADALSRMLRAQVASSPFTLAVYGEGGGLLTRSPLPTPAVLLGTTLPESLRADVAIGEEGTMVDAFSAAEPKIWGFVRLRRVPATVLVSLPMSEVMAAWRRDLFPSFLFGLVALAGLASLGVLAVRRAQAEEAGQRRLVEAGRALELMLDEKDVLLAEVHHRVKNNMQVIVNLLQMEQARLTDPAARTRLDALSCRVALMGRVHERLYASESFSRLDFLGHLRDHCADLVRHRPGARVTVAGDTLSCGLDLALPLALIAHELVANALDHGGASPLVEVGLTRHADAVTLSVADNGTGPDEGNPPGGLGMLLVRALAEQIDAEVASQTSEGYCVTVVVPLVE